MDMCIEIYLAAFHKDDDLGQPEEIQDRIGELEQLLVDEDDLLEKSRIFLDIAVLHLGPCSPVTSRCVIYRSVAIHERFACCVPVNGEDDNCKNVCQTVLELAGECDDLPGYVQTCLLLAAASGDFNKANQ